MAHATFGLFDWIDRGTAPLHRLYAERLQLLEAADTAGFFCYHLAEHHATPLGMAPSPALFLTAAAQHTQRIRLGPLVYLLPLYNPLRLIEEVCMLDNLSGGRLELGIGRGVTPYELGYFGVDAAGSRPIFDEALTVLVAGLTQRKLTFAGKHYQYHDVPMELVPYQQPYPPLWYPTHNPESVLYAARHGYHFVTLGAAAHVRELVDMYRQTWEMHRHDPDRLNGHVTAPRVGILRQVVVASTDEEALGPHAPPTRTGTVPSPSSGTTTTTTLPTASSTGRRPRSTRPSSSGRPRAFATRWPDCWRSAAATTSSVHSPGAACRPRKR